MVIDAVDQRGDENAAGGQHKARWTSKRFLMSTAATTETR